MIDRQEFRTVLRTILGLAVLPCLAFVAMAWPGLARAGGQDRAAPAASAALWPISMDYPEDGSIFPPGITPPTFIWRDGVASSWSIEVRFADHSPALHDVSKGERMHLGAIDPECVAETNEPPRLSPQQAASWVWKPAAATWKAIQAHSVQAPATLVVTGYKDSGQAVSRHEYPSRLQPIRWALRFSTAMCR